ncbi:MAG: S1 RNA-binding domain-containing protein [Anaerolineales bacterium]|nr:S1 RNA-binding domain-containing protein [Anaerolineales bacterium]MCA9926868.1 S1 RNA-binding domain-containing protein [Anaerolineales bacterium]
MSEAVTETTAEEAAPTQPKTINDLEPKMKLQGSVVRLELYGAFIDIGVGINALVHISQLGKEHVNRVADVLSVGDNVSVWVDKVDPQREQIMVTMIEPLAVDWKDLKVGQTHTGTVSRLETYGAFINIGAEREGLVHISELSHDYVKHPSEVMNVGDEVETQVLGFSKRKRRIDLSIKALLEKPEEQYTPAKQQVEAYPEFAEEEIDDMPTAMEIALRAAMGDSFPPPKQSKRERRRKNRRRDKMRNQQEDLLDRTLHR